MRGKSTSGRTKLLIGIVLLFNVAAADSQNADKIIIGTVVKIFSNALHEDREIWVYNPGSGQANIPGKQRYPGLYLLDAEDHFYATVGMIKQMSGRWPEMIVVGIKNINRSRDLRKTW